MSVDSSKPRRILVIHGVEAGKDEDQHQDEDVTKLIQTRLSGAPLDFETEMYRYENINDRAQRRLRNVLSLFKTNILEEETVDIAVDIVGDVVITLQDGSTAATIRQGLVDRIEETFEEGNPLYLLAHSLGSIYAFDAVNELIDADGYFERDDRKTWPVQGLITIGSPIGLRMFKRSKVTSLGEGTKSKFLRWINYWDRTDPIVSGSFYGKPNEGYNIVERFATDEPEVGWLIQDRVVDVGRAWLEAHVGYWSHPGLGDDLVALLG
jgi:hypothetical protein